MDGVFCTPGDLSGELGLTHEHCFSLVADGLTQSHRATALVVQQHLHSAAVFSHNNLLIKLTEHGQGQNHLTLTSRDSDTGMWGCSWAHVFKCEGKDLNLCCRVV